MWAPPYADPEAMSSIAFLRLVVIAGVASAALVGCGDATVQNSEEDQAIELRSATASSSDRPGYSAGSPPQLRQFSPSDQLPFTVSHKADATEFEEVAAVFHGYLDALAEGDWELACAYLSPIAQRTLQSTAEKEGKPDTSCLATLPEQIDGTPEELRREASLADIGSIRVSGGFFDPGFVVYRIGNGLAVMDMTDREGRWQMLYANPRDLVPSR